MNQGIWVAIVATALAVLFSLGVYIGRNWSASRTPAMPPPPQDWSEAILHRVNDLLGEVRDVLACSDNHVAHIDQARRTMAPASPATDADAESVQRTMAELSSEMASIRGRLRVRFQMTEAAASEVRRLCATAAATEGAKRESTAEGSCPAESSDVAAALDRAKRDERRSYQAVEKFAYYKSGQTPRPEEFTPVQCLDLSAGGVSFLTSEQPRPETIVITISEGSDVAHRTARIVHTAKVETPTGTAFRVGCQFIGQLDLR